MSCDDCLDLIDRDLQEAAESIMTMTVRIDRDSGDEDPYGGKQAQSWQEHLVVPCRAWHTNGSDVLDGEKVVALGGRRMILPKDTDISVRDRIAWVKDRAGNIIFDGPAKIDVVAWRNGHVLVELESLR
jgi:hypothetical protein